MNLTKDDLQAIQQTIKSTIQPMIDELAVDTAAGFAEVHQKVDKLTFELSAVKDTAGRIELVQRAEISRADQQGVEIAKLKKQLA